MTDNEKRAHDLAIAALPDLMHNSQYQPYSRIENGSQVKHFRHFEAYFDAYSKFLEIMNKTFTDSDHQAQ